MEARVDNGLALTGRGSDVMIDMDTGNWRQPLDIVGWIQALGIEQHWDDSGCGRTAE